MTWAIIADSSCNIRSMQPKRADAIYALAPLKVTVGEREYNDDASLDVAALNRELRNSTDGATTSCPSVGEWAELFRLADNVIAIAISSNLSASYEAAIMARNIVMDEYAREHNGVIAGKNIFVLDSKAAGGKLEVIVELLDDFLARGNPTFEQAVTYVTGLERASGVLYSLSSYDNLVKAGRMPRIAGKIASQFNVRLLGTASAQGALKMIGTTRSERRMVKKVTETMEDMGYEGGKAYVDHVENRTGADLLAGAIKAKWPGADVSIMPCGGLCSCYAESSGLIVGFEWYGTER